MEIIKEPVAGIQAQIYRNHYSTTITADNHSFILDEPILIGGADCGPNPQQLLLASLGGCTAITLRMYIDRKMWIVEHIMVDVKQFNIDGIALFEVKLAFKGELSDEQRSGLVKIAEACPIHKLLSGTNVIKTSLL